ncbi:MAG: hypothetical protein WA658_11215, partial [Candidatus Acidiferrales bacterium]
REFALLRRRSCSSTDGHAGEDPGAELGLRVDGKLPVHQLQALLDADEAEPAAVYRLLNVKTGSKIAHGEIHRV